MSRVLHITSPYTQGHDVGQLQIAIRKVFAAVEEPCSLHVDKAYGPATASAEAHAAYIRGAASPHDHKRAQQIILHPLTRTPAELARASKYKRMAAERHTHGAEGMVHLALKLAHHTPPYTENPAGSNTDRGGIIDIAQKEVGIAASYYCGAGVHYLAKHGGGVDLTPEVRYCPSAEAHARAGTGGFLKLVAPHEIQMGDAVTFDEGGIAGHIETAIEDYKPGTETVHTVGWNTSPEGGSGSNSNGGGIFEHFHRPIGGGFHVRYGLRIRWNH